MLYAVHLLSLLFVALISLLAAWWVRRKTRDRAGTATSVLLIGHGTIALLTIVQLLGSTQAWQVFWYRVWFSIGIVLPIVWFLLAVYYTGREHWLTKPVWAIILASPVVPLLMWFTDPIFGLVVVDFAFQSDPFDYLVPTFTGSWLLLYTLIGLYPLFAFGLFAQMFIWPRRHSRWKPGAVLVGIIAIWITTWLMGASFVPAQGFPYGHYGNGIFGVLIAVALFRTKFFGVTPLAHEAIFESIDDAIIVVDANRLITDFNEPARRVFPQLEGRTGDQLDDAYPALIASDDSCADGGGATAIVEQLEGSLDTPFAGSIRVSSARGESRTLRINVSEITSGGEPRGYALIMRDVTELEQYALDLEHKTDQLERFASVLSHDLRNPISIATGYVEHTRETGNLEHLTDVEIALERMEETIDDLLTLSREGESIDEADDVALRSLVGEAWATSDTRELTLENELDPAFSIRADPSRVQTLLENLFRNAADHGAETVQVDSLETSHGFAVADDGPGIPPDDRDRVFEYGYSSTADGTGLGLSIVSSVAAAHGWSVSITESEAGGAQFEITNVERAYSSAESGSDVTGVGTDGTSRTMDSRTNSAFEFDTASESAVESESAALEGDPTDDSRPSRQ